ncbi:DAK2 domain-containing protein [Sodalis sp. C49]|uniref:DAK2 domain-containing protein n=1 Tax=unclassified Sodalis (in: enterobacteria) TaxID=2636512 RepID=UPI003965C2B7
MTNQELIALLTRCTAKIREVSPRLNELDGRLGDGDLGATLEKCARLTDQALAAAPADIAPVFQAAAMACVRASGSSFGTLLGVALLTAAQQCAGKTTLRREDIAPLLEAVLAALMARGGASLGDKTVLDPLDAVRRALQAAAPGDDYHALAVGAVRATLEEYRQKPNKIGRARMFAERSIGLDDPGMVAFACLVHAAAGHAAIPQEVS